MTGGNPFGGFNAHTMAHRLRRAEAMAPNGTHGEALRFVRVFDDLCGDDRARLRRFARHQRLAEEAASECYITTGEREPFDTSRLDAMDERELREETDRLAIFLRAWQDGHDSQPCGLCARP